jgi:hypothetical protein
LKVSVVWQVIRADYEYIVEKYTSCGMDGRISLSIPSIGKERPKRGFFREPRLLPFFEVLTACIPRYCGPFPWEDSFVQELDEVQQGFQVVQDMRLCKETVSLDQCPR